MGREKALLDVAGATLIERTLGTLAKRFEELFVSVGACGPSEGLRGALERFEKEHDHRVGIVRDRIEGVGPLAGLQAALEEIAGERAFFLAVDLPHVCFRLVDLLWEEALRGGSGCMPLVGGRPEPVFAVYSKTIAERIPGLVAAGRRSLHALRHLDGFRVLDLDATRWQARLFTTEADPGARAACLARLFRNINTPEDYRAWVREEA